jgi:hypothetical protein
MLKDVHLRDSVVLQPICHANRAILAAWQRSRTTLNSLADRLQPAVRKFPDVIVAASGSLARMEQGFDSDADLILLVDRRVADDEQQSLSLTDAVRNAVQEEGLALPDPNGIFLKPVEQTTLCDVGRRGRIAEDPSVFGIRIQLLLDAQPLVNPRGFRSLQHDILHWYAETDSPAPTSQPWHYLQHDLQRYFHSLAVTCHFSSRTDHSAWRLAQIKFHHSRRLMVEALQLLLLAAQQGTQPIPWVAQHLSLTPLERVATVCRPSGNNGEIGRVLSAYDRFLDFMMSDGRSEQLRDRSGADRLNSPPAFDLLLRNGEQLEMALDRMRRMTCRE